MAARVALTQFEDWRNQASQYIESLEQQKVEMEGRIQQLTRERDTEVRQLVICVFSVYLWVASLSEFEFIDSTDIRGTLNADGQC